MVCINFQKKLNKITVFDPEPMMSPDDIFPKLSEIGFNKVNFQEHTFQKNSIGPQVETVGRILNTRRPKTKKECRSLLG